MAAKNEGEMDDPKTLADTPETQEALEPEPSPLTRAYSTTLYSYQQSRDHLEWGLQLQPRAPRKIHSPSVLTSTAAFSRVHNPAIHSEAQSRKNFDWAVAIEEGRTDVSPQKR